MIKFKGKYSNRKKKKDDRDVISYEDMPLDDYEQEKTDISTNAVKKIIISICIALVAGLIVFAFANRDNLTFNSLSNWWTYDVLGNGGNGYPVDIVGSDVQYGNFKVTNGHISYASDTSFVTLNSTGQEVSNFQLRYSKPIMKNSGSKYLTFGLGSKGYQVDDFDKLVRNGEAEDNIYTGDIASNGTYCLVTEANDYLSALYVYNSNNNKIFKYYFSEYYITSIAMNNDGSGCVASGISADNGVVSGKIYVLDFSKEEPVTVTNIKGDTVIDCKYISNNRVALIGNTASYILSVGDKELKENSYKDMALSNYCFNTDTNCYAVALSKSGDGRSNTIISYNDNAENICSINTLQQAQSLAMYKNQFMLLDGNTAFVYNTDGTKLFECGTGAGSKKTVFASDSTIYVLSANQIRFIDLNNTSTADFVVASTNKE